MFEVGEKYNIVIKTGEDFSSLLENAEILQVEMPLIKVLAMKYGSCPAGDSKKETIINTSSSDTLN